MQLREYQQRTVDAIREKAASGSRRILVVLPTGAGKTHTMATLVHGAIGKGNKVLALMHRRGLVEQMQERFTECHIDSGLIMSGVDTALHHDCQIASLWTYVRRLQLAEKSSNKFFIDAPCLLIDEAHHVLNNTYQKVLKDYENAFVIGFTATPTLSTGAGLGQYFDSMVNVVSMDELLDGGWLVPGEYYGPTEPDVERLKIVQGDYEKKGLDRAMNRPELIGDVVNNWFEAASNLQTMVFAVNRKHARALCEEYLKCGVNAEYLDARNGDEERSDVLRRFDNGDTQVICQVALYTEGTDIPAIQCLVIARPTRSLGLHRQILGRGARPFPGKEKFIVLDHGGNVNRLGFYEDEVRWDLNGKEGSNQLAKPRKKERTILTCEMCKFAFTGPVCPQCGHQIKNYGKKIEAIEAELVRLDKGKTPKATMAEKELFYRMLEYYRRQKMYADGWRDHKFRSKFGTWPRGFKGLGPAEPDQKFYSWIKYQNIKWAKSKQKRENQLQEGFVNA